MSEFPAALVEQVAQAIYYAPVGIAKAQDRQWSSGLPEQARNAWRDRAQAALAAARPHIAAETLREAAENLTYALDEDEDHIAGIADAHAQLMRRADEIEGGASGG